MANLNPRGLVKASLLALISITPSLAVPASYSTSNYSSYSSNSSLSWQNCTLDFFGPLGDTAGEVPPGMQCATLSVPLNWAKPHGNHISLSLSRIQAANQSARIGSLIVNPGGPGGSAIEYLAGIALGVIYMTPAVLESFDIVAVDPRGVGLSSPVKCDPDLYNERVSLYPKDEAAFDSLITHNRAFGESCLNKTGELLHHVDTVSTARDLEILRLALGDGEMNFLGFSYGTQLGAAYAELFPDNVRAMVLDANVDHSLSETAALFTNAQTTENVLNKFFEWCDNSTDCALHGSNSSTAKLFDDLVAKADATPISAPQCNGTCRSDVTGEEILFHVTGSLNVKSVPYPYNLYTPTWQNLSLSLAGAILGDASGLSMTLATEETGFGVTTWNGIATGCLDWTHTSTSLTDLAYKSHLLTPFPHTRGAIQLYQYQTQCIGWPSHVNNPPRPARARGAPPILLLNSLYDPECSYTWAEGLRHQIEGSVLVTRDGVGHGSYGYRGEADSVVDAYLVDLKVSEQGLVVES